MQRPRNLGKFVPLLCVELTQMHQNHLCHSLDQQQGYK